VEKENVTSAMVHSTLGRILNGTREAAAVGRGARAPRCGAARLAIVLPRRAAATPIESITAPRGGLQTGAISRQPLCRCLS
jgi:hypothetical protein